MVQVTEITAGSAKRTPNLGALIIRIGFGGP